MVLGAVQSRAPCAQKALAELCGLYWRPLYAFARRRGRSPEDAQDLVQGFFEHLIGSRGLATVERSKGRFRSFLLASFQNFIAAETRRAGAEKRGGRAELIRLDWRDAEARLGFEPEDQLTPAAAALTGEIQQVPPAISAIKVASPTTMVIAMTPRRRSA